MARSLDWLARPASGNPGLSPKSCGWRKRAAGNVTSGHVSRAVKTAVIWSGAESGAACFPSIRLTSAEVQIERLTEKAMLLNPQWIQRLPLLDAVLQLPIPESDLTGSLDAKVRKTSLHSLLIDLLRALTATEPTLIVLEDCHWLDPLSAELLKEVGGAIYDRPVCLLLVSRESPSGHLETSETAAPYVEIQLSQFGPEEAGQLIRAKLAQLSGNELPVPEGLIDRLVTQSQGNPFYLEELIAYLYFQGLLNGKWA